MELFDTRLESSDTRLGRLIRLKVKYLRLAKGDRRNGNGGLGGPGDGPTWASIRLDWLITGNPKHRPRWSKPTGMLAVGSGGKRLRTQSETENRIRNGAVRERYLYVSCSPATENSVSENKLCRRKNVRWKVKDGTTGWRTKTNKTNGVDGSEVA